MTGHKFTDDVALCIADSKAHAIKKFSRYYADVTKDEVFKLFDRRRNPDKAEDWIYILTDY